MSFRLKGVDISGANGNVDFEMLKRNGISFVMINLGNLFADNVKKAEAAGMPWGAYYYTYSLSPEEDRQELDKILGRLAGKKPTYPVAIDVEDGDGYKSKYGGWNRENVSRNARYLLGGLRKAGYYPMIYTGFEEVENLLDRDIYMGVDMWWAQWSTRCGYPENNLGMWQFGGETNYICSPYIEGEIFDQNYAYKDYPTIIKSGGWNGWGNGSGDIPAPKPTPKPTPEPADTPTVADVQTWLNENYNAGLEIDGIYGSLTRAALVAALQTELNRQTGADLDVDGIFGACTASAIFNVKNGMQGKITRILQGLLLCNGYGAGGFDGIFGGGTEAAVREFQYQNALDVDGIAGQQTFEALAV